MKRKYLALVCCIAVLMAMFAVRVAAADENEAVSEEIVTESTEVIASDGEESTVMADVFSRIFEFSVDHKIELIDMAGSALLVGLAAILEKRRKDDAEDAKKKLGVVVGSSTNTESSQVSVVSAMNNMITGYNSMREMYEKYEGAEGDRDRLTGALMVEVTAVLEILMAVYVNNKNLPQGVKDLVTLRYTNAQKAIGDDELLASIVATVRERVNFEEVPTEEADETEVAEV